MVSQSRTDTHSVDNRLHSPSASNTLTVNGSQMVPLIIVLALMTGISLAFSVFCMLQVSKYEREVRLLQLYIDTRDRGR